MFEGTFESLYEICGILLRYTVKFHLFQVKVVQKESPPPHHNFLES